MYNKQWILEYNTDTGVEHYRFETKDNLFDYVIALKIPYYEVFKLYGGKYYEPKNDTNT